MEESVVLRSSHFNPMIHLWNSCIVSRENRAVFRVFVLAANLFAGYKTISRMSQRSSGTVNKYVNWGRKYSCLATVASIGFRNNILAVNSLVPCRSFVRRRRCSGGSGSFTARKNNKQISLTLWFSRRVLLEYFLCPCPGYKEREKWRRNLDQMNGCVQRGQRYHDRLHVVYHKCWNSTLRKCFFQLLEVKVVIY